MDKNIIKRVSASAAITFGVVFSITMLLNVWGVFNVEWAKRMVLEKIMATCGILSASFIALLIVMKLTENKK